MMKSRARDARSMCQNINATFSPQNQTSPGIKTNANASTQQKKRLTHPSKRSALLPHLRNQPTPQAMSLQLCSSNDTSLSIVSHCSPTTPNLHSSADSEYTDHDQSDDSQISDISHRSYRTRHSLISSSSVPTSSPDEALVRGRFFILNDSYPSSEHEDVNGIPLAFLGAEKLVRIRVDWRNVHYPLSAYYTEIIIDLFLTRPFLVREIPKVHNFSLYRPLTKTLRGELFFDYENHRAAVHQCHRKQAHGTLPQPFTIEDLITIHRREFHLITYNTVHEQRFLNVLECLFPVHVYQSQSTDWKVYLTKSVRRKTMLDRTVNVPRDLVRSRYLNTPLTLNQVQSSSTTSKSEQRLKRQTKQ